MKSEMVQNYTKQIGRQNKHVLEWVDNLDMRNAQRLSKHNQSTDLQTKTKTITNIDNGTVGFCFLVYVNRSKHCALPGTTNNDR